MMRNWIVRNVTLTVVWFPWFCVPPDQLWHRPFPSVQGSAGESRLDAHSHCCSWNGCGQQGWTLTDSYTLSILDQRRIASNKNILDPESVTGHYGTLFCSLLFKQRPSVLSSDGLKRIRHQSKNHFLPINKNKEELLFQNWIFSPS